MGNTFQTGRLINGLFVDASGNVGIGTTTPAEKLSVIGNIRIDNGAADGGQLVLASSGFSDWNIDNFSGRFRAYYGATERFTITASGAVGIGTNNPQSLLDVKGATPFIRITDSSVTGETGIIMDASGGFIRGGLTINYGTGEYKSYCGIAGNSYFQTFHTNGSERMRISSTGNVGIGTSSPNYPLSVSIVSDIWHAAFGDTSSNGKMVRIGGYGQSGVYGVIGAYSGQTNSSPIPLILQRDGSDVYIGTTSDTGKLSSVSDASNKVAIQARVPNGASVPIIQASSVTVGSTSWYALVTQSGNGTAVTVNTLFIYGNGNVVNVNNSYGALSDIKLKENIVDATPKLADLMQLRVRNYNLIADESKTKQIGFIAQEFEEVFPGLVEESPDKDVDGNNLGTATKSIKTSVLVPMLVKAIQELSAKVTALENK